MQGKQDVSEECRRRIEELRLLIGDLTKAQAEKDSLRSSYLLQQIERVVEGIRPRVRESQEDPAGWSV